MALKPFNSPGGFSVGELTTGVVNVVTSTGNVITGNILPSTGAANVGNLNILAGNVIVAGGAGYVYANGAFLTGINGANIVGGYSNANVANYLPTYTGNLASLTGNVITTGNVSGGFLLGNIRFATGGYNDANVAAYTGALTNLTGNVTTTANVQAAYLIGNISGATGGYGNTNVKAYLESGDTINANIGSGSFTTTGNISTTANISAGNFVGSGSNTTVAADGYNWIFDNTGNLTLAGNTFAINYANGAQVTLAGQYSNSNVAAYLPTYTGNVGSGAGYIFGNGAFLTGLPAQYSNANVANYLPVYGGDLLTNNITNTGNVVIQGNLQVLGTETIINTTTLTVADINIVVANGAPNPAAANGAGIMVGNSGNSYSDITWTSPANVWTFNSNGIVTYGNLTATGGNVSGTYILGNGAFLTGLPAGYSNADVANYLASNANVTILTTGDITTAGNVSADNYTGLGSNVELVIGSNVWTFDANLTLPSNTWNVRYANGAYVQLGGNYGNSDVANYLASGALTSNITTTGNVNSSGLYNTGNLINTGAIYATGRINTDDSLTAKEITSNGFIQASGVITTSANVVGNNVSANTNISAGANITAAGNVNSNGLYNTGNLINTGAIYATGRINTDDSLTAKEITSNGFIQASGIISTSANIIAGNILANTNVIATGNVVGTYILGNGAFLTGLPAGYSNADVANYLASNANVTIVTQGNITTQGAVNAAVFNGTTSNIELQAGSNTWVLDQTGNLTLPTNNWQVNYANGTPVSLAGNYTNANVIALLGSNTNIAITVGTGNITTQGTVRTGGIFNTGAIYSSGLINTDDSLTAKEITSNGFIQASGVITTTGNIVANNATINNAATIATLTVSQDAVVLGNLRVDGNTTFINANTLNIGDKNIILANGAATASDANGGGIQLGNVGANGFTEIYWVSTSNTWVLNSNAVSTVGNVSANYLLGNGAFITGLPAGYANSNVKSFLNTANSGLNFVTSGGGYVEMQGTEFGAVRAAGYFETTASTSLANLAVIPVSTLSSGTRALEATIRGELDGNTQVGKLIVTWETVGNTSDYSRYGEVILGAGCGIPSATFDGTNVLIQVTPRVATSTDWTVSVTSL